LAGALPQILLGELTALQAPPMRNPGYATDRQTDTHTHTHALSDRERGRGVEGEKGF